MGAFIITYVISIIISPFVLKYQLLSRKMWVTIPPNGFYRWPWFSKPVHYLSVILPIWHNYGMWPATSNSRGSWQFLMRKQRESNPQHTINVLRFFKNRPSFVRTTSFCRVARIRTWDDDKVPSCSQNTHATNYTTTRNFTHNVKELFLIFFTFTGFF